jgi:hypothetical protein
MIRGFCVALAMALASAGSATAQTPLFSENSELEVTIEAPFTTLLRTARRNTDPHPGALVHNGQHYGLLVSARGETRRTTDRCSFPPLRIDFENNELSATLFRGQNRLKLTTHCRPNANYAHYYVLEYMAYRLYNEITPMSFRARPLRVTYHDIEGRRDDETRFGFFIEDEDDLARRNGRTALEIETGAVTSAQLDAAAAARVALFQLMIGNVDWDMLQSAEGRDCCHNTRLLAASESARNGLIPAPYDFDSSGLVDAPYAAPPANLRMSSVRDRYYRGYCRHNDQIPGAIALFQSRREALNALIAGETRLSEQRRETARRYIDGFFELISDPQRVQRQVIERCRQSDG